jgi:CBS domain-containing protein
LSCSDFATKGKAMQMVSEVMTRDVMFVAPQESLQRAAQMMDDLNVGVLPVCDGKRLVGMITDRDIIVRATSAGTAPGDAHVEDVMSADVRWCFEDQPLDEVMQQMADTQIRRVPVISHDDAHILIGIVSLGDLATKTSDDAAKQEVEQVVEKVSSPSEPDRSGQPGTAGAAGTAGRGAGSEAGIAGTAGVAGAVGGTDAAAGARTAGTAGGTDNTGGTGAPGGTDAAGATGATGGTAGTGGSSGTDAGARP